MESQTLMDLGDEMFKDDANTYEGSIHDIDAEAQEFALDAIENAKHIQNDNYYFRDSPTMNLLMH